jgi:hypothetical protein
VPFTTSYVGNNGGDWKREAKNKHKIVGVKPTGKSPLDRRKGKWEDNTKMDFKRNTV